MFFFSRWLLDIRQEGRNKIKHNQSGHLIDAKLQYILPQDHQAFLDAVSPEIREKIEESGSEIMSEGMSLTVPQHKLVHALSLLLHKKSSKTTDPGLYEGNMPSLLVPYGVECQAWASVLKLKPVELYSAYFGNWKYSQRSIQFINNELHKLEQRKIYFKYERVRKEKVKNKMKSSSDIIEDFQSLIKILSFIPTSIETKGEIIVVLNPIFTDQIDTKFVPFPADINRRLIMAAGDWNKVSASMYMLMEWMLREMSNKRYKVEINEKKLPYLLGLNKYVKEGRKKRISERIGLDIEAIKNIGIILSAEKIPNVSGAHKWIFHLKKDYQ